MSKHKKPEDQAAPSSIPDAMPDRPDLASFAGDDDEHDAHLGHGPESRATSNPPPVAPVASEPPAKSGLARLMAPMVAAVGAVAGVAGALRSTPLSELAPQEFDSAADIEAELARLGDPFQKFKDTFVAETSRIRAEREEAIKDWDAKLATALRRQQEESERIHAGDLRRIHLLKQRLQQIAK